MDSAIVCVTCGKRLQGRQRRFCCRACKNANTNTRLQSYSAQQARGLQRKIALLEESGGRCSRCGYDRNIAALTWHHTDPTVKNVSLDLRSLSNRSDAEIRREFESCVLLCANCHAEEHFPQIDRSMISVARQGKPR